MNTSLKTMASSALIGVLFFASTPLTGAESRKAAGAARCQELSGREKSRCMYVLEHSGRLRVSAPLNAVSRSNTVRDSRVIRRSTTTSNIRRIGNYNLSRLRRHSQDGGNARRMINSRDEFARNACKYLEGTAQSMCIRAGWRGLSRGNTR
ncbi:hypothetical protein HOL63_00345 [Candidatus Peregrinibacteria bacterium]|nr:hypothetical protein [Candidatus Peregrinibacteria bacterium]MBT5468678.1 hypothetical protein [Candidatus Peregrinibacteria bacterium]MBT7337790.1 hypothetical protein [Candidatus Peregrinibacteria bacterium]